MLYPTDSTLAGQELRLRQEYLFSSASIQDTQHYFEQQRASLAKIDPDSILILDAALANTVRRIDPLLDRRVIIVPQLSATLLPPRAAEGERDGLALFLEALESDDPLLIQHSSGTTGVKKAVSRVNPKETPSSPSVS